MPTLRDLRKAAGLTQVELATRANISQAHVSDLENGDRELGLKAARGIAVALDLPIDVVVGLDKPDHDSAVL